MTVNDIYAYLNEFCPFDTACDFDNVGLLVGDKNATVTKAVIALDCTLDAVNQAIETGAELIITHHPVIFSPLKSVTAESIVYRLIKNNISVISAHTNLDVADGGVNDCLAATLNLCDVETVVADDGFTFRKGVLDTECTPDEFALYVKNALNFSPRFTVGQGKIKTVAVCGGSGGDMLYDALNAGADALVTAEVKHHVFLDAADIGFTLIDCGHFNTEDVVVKPLKNLLSKKFPDITFTTNHKSYIHSI